MLINDGEKLKQHYNRNLHIEIFIIILFFLADSRFFYLVPLPSLFSGPASNKILVSVFAVICTLILIILNRKIYFGKYSGYIAVLYIFLIYQGFFERSEYQYTATTIIYSLIPYLILLMYFGISTYLLNGEYAFNLLCIISEWITIILSVVLLLQLYIYNRTHIMFLNFVLGDWYTKYHITANGRFYSVSEGFVRVIILVSFFDILRTKNHTYRRKLSASAMIFGILNIIFVDQSRVYLIQIIIAILIMYFIYNNKLDTKNFIVTILILLVAIIILSFKLSSVMDTLTNSTDGSSYARIGAIAYYLSILDRYLFTGLGIVIPDEGTLQYSFIKGANGIYNNDDIGVFGVLASMGIIIVIWYFLIIIKNFRLSFKIHDQSKRALALGLAIMMLLGLMTMSYLDKERIMSLTLTLTLIDYCNRTGNLMEEK